MKIYGQVHLRNESLNKRIIKIKRRMIMLRESFGVYDMCSELSVKRLPLQESRSMISVY